MNNQEIAALKVLELLNHPEMQTPLNLAISELITSKMGKGNIISTAFGMGAIAGYGFAKGDVELILHHPEKVII